MTKWESVYQSMIIVVKPRECCVVLRWPCAMWIAAKIRKLNERFVKHSNRFVRKMRIKINLFSQSVEVESSLRLSNFQTINARTFLHVIPMILFAFEECFDCTSLFRKFVEQQKFNSPRAYLYCRRSMIQKPNLLISWNGVEWSGMVPIRFSPKQKWFWQGRDSLSLSPLRLLSSHFRLLTC